MLNAQPGTPRICFGRLFGLPAAGDERLTTCRPDTVMNTLLTIDFYYNDQAFQALILCKRVLGRQEFQVTIMNGVLEASLYGNHIFVSDENRVVPRKECGDITLLPLQEAVRQGLQVHLDTLHWDLEMSTASVAP